MKPVITMSTSSIISIFVIVSGSAIMLLSIFLGLKIKRIVSRDLSAQWLFAIVLMSFFFVCYIVVAVIMLFRISFPLEVFTSSVFLGGACFVLIVMILAKTSIRDLIDEIIERKKAEDALKESENKLKAVFDNMQDVFYRTDRKGNLIWVSPSAVKLLGCQSIGDILGRNLTDFYLLPDEKKVFLEKLSKSGKIAETDVAIGRYDGFKIIVSTSARYYTDDDGNIAGVEGICRDVTARKKAEEVLHFLSLTDDLTGLYNRRGFFTLADHHLKKIRRQRTEYCLLFADLDNLKVINDTYGHQEGDKALTSFSSILRTTFRESDVIARIGGDEFVVFPVTLSESGEGLIVSRLQDNLDSFNRNGEHGYRLSFSFGIARCDPDASCTVEDLLESADRLMYDHKSQKNIARK